MRRPDVPIRPDRTHRPGRARNRPRRVPDGSHRRAPRDTPAPRRYGRRGRYGPPRYRRARRRGGGDARRRERSAPRRRVPKTRRRRRRRRRSRECGHRRRRATRRGDPPVPSAIDGDRDVRRPRRRSTLGASDAPRRSTLGASDAPRRRLRSRVRLRPRERRARRRPPQIGHHRVAPRAPGPPGGRGGTGRRGYGERRFPAPSGGGRAAERRRGASSEARVGALARGMRGV